MDLSKLPKLSDTPKPPSNEPEKESVRPDYARADLDAVDAGASAMLWVSMILGLLCMGIGRNFASYTIAKMTGHEYHTNATWAMGPQAGQEVAYWDLQGYAAFTDAGIFLFGLSMVLEGFALAMIRSKLGGKRIAISISLVIVALATLVNLYTATRLLGIGLIPLMSGLAVALGGYMAIYQWKLLRVLTSGRAVPMT